jgi:diketogulonate reductase-like aldo/keto reductase
MFSKELGGTGVQIPEIGMGTWQYHAGPQALQAGLEAGALFIDTAESYGTEPVVADAICGGRDRVFLATKVSPQHFRRADLLSALDASLGRLRTDYVDLYQLHKPNDAIPLAETLGAMEDAVDAGKVRFIGVSNFSLPQLQQAQDAMRRHPIVSNQVRFNLIDRAIRDDLLPFCQAHRITIIAYSPLARGVQHIVDSDQQGALTTVASETGRTPIQVALNWCVSPPGVVAIPKGNSADHVLEACGASGWRLDPEQIRELEQSITFRRRSGMEEFLRQHLPPGGKTAIQRLARHLPRAVRSRIH